MRDIVFGFSFIFSVCIYLAIAIFLKDTIKPSFVSKKDISNIIFILSFLIFLLSLYFAKFKTFQKKIFAFTLAEIPVIFSLGYFFLTGYKDLLIKLSIVSILVMLYITFLKGEKIEN